MEWKCEMGKECGPEDGEKKRPKHQGDLIQEQQKECKENTAVKSCGFVMDRIRTGENRQTYRCVSPRTLYQDLDLLGPVCGEITDVAQNFEASSAQAVTPMSVIPWRLSTFFRDEHRCYDFSDERRRLHQLDSLNGRHLRLMRPLLITVRPYRFPSPACNRSLHAGLLVRVRIRRHELRFWSTKYFGGDRTFHQRNDTTSSRPCARGATTSRKKFNR